MKQILLFFFLLPTLLLGQTSSWRSGATTAPRQSSVQSNIESSQPNRSYETSRWRNESQQRVYPNTPYYRNRNIWVGGMYPWYNGFGYYNMYPYFWYDDFGYRQRSRVVVYDDGRKDTVKVKPMRYAFGLQISQGNQIGGWLAIGHENYVLLEYQQTTQKHSSSYFPLGHLGIVDFPLVEDWVSNKVFYAGVGKRYGRNGLHISLGFGNEEVRFQGKDNIGFITFPKYNSDFLTMKFGIIHDFKYATLKLDYDPIRRYGIFGMGINL